MGFPIPVRWHLYIESRPSLLDLGGYDAQLISCLTFLLVDVRHADSCAICSVSTLRPRRDRRHFADDIFTYIFFSENCCILIKCSLKYIRKGPIDNNSALVQIMAWRRSGDKPLSEPMMISSTTHICVTRPQWVYSNHWCGNMISYQTYFTGKTTSCFISGMHISCTRI